MKPCRFNSLLHLWLSATLTVSLASSAYASDTQPYSYTELLLDDIHHVVTAPSRWEKEEWQGLGWASLAVAGTALVVDAPLRDAMRRQPQNNSFMLNIERFGAEYSVAVAGGFYLAGSITDNEKAILLAQDSLTASIIASGLITPALKIIAGRDRPYENTGTNNFQSLGASNPSSSFPSGHTTEAFALASVISAHYDEKWIKSSAYTVATFVGIARTYHDAHFASDVLAGALIGNFVGQQVVAHNQSKRSTSVILFPEASHDLTGLRLTGSF